MTTQNCLADSEIVGFLAEEPGALRLAEINAHLKECKSCRKRVDQACDDDALLASVNRALGSDSAPLPVVIKVAGLTVSGGTFEINRNEAPRNIPKISGFRITGVLGQGGMGIVYRAVQERLNRTVALKVLPAMVGSASPAAVARFRREAAAAAKLHHTNIVPIYDFGESPDAYYYAMELVIGRPLDQLVRTFTDEKAPSLSGPQFQKLLQSAVLSGVKESDSARGQADPSAEKASHVSSSGRGRVYFQLVARWIADVAEALHYAHGEGIVHRDIKPANLLLSVDGRMMVADFGLATSVDTSSVTMTGALIGTLRYLSPEQAMAKRILIDHRTDVYSLGVTLYELLALRPAYLEDDDKSLLAAVIQKDPTSPRKIEPSVPRELETICCKAMEKLPDARYSTARAMAEDLRRYLNDLPIAARPPNLAQRSFKFIKRNRAVVAIVVAGLTTTALAMLIPASIRLAEEGADEKVAALVNQAINAGDHGNWPEAVHLCEQALTISPNNLKAMANLARIKVKMFNTSTKDVSLLLEAKSLCDRALEMDNSVTPMWNIKGVVLKKLNRWEEAVHAFERADQLAPGDPAILENIGVLTALRRELAKSQETLQRAGEIASREELPYCNIWQSLAQVQLVLSDAGAVRSIEKAKECNPSDPHVCLTAARILLSLKGHEQPSYALDLAKWTRHLAGDDFPRVHRILAFAFLRNGDTTKAMEHARLALQQDDLPSFNYLIIAMAQAREGEHAEARESLTRADALWPKDLAKPGEFRPLAPTQVLWIESANELFALKEEAETLLASENAPGE